MYFVVEDNNVMDSFSVEPLQQSEIDTILDIDIPGTTKKYKGMNLLKV